MFKSYFIIASILENVPKDLYDMSTKVKVIHSLPLQASPTDKQISVTLQPGEEVIILSSDNKEWCLVETAQGKKGWFAIDGFNKIRGTWKMAEQIFEGLSSAD